MKKLISLILALLLIFIFAGCKDKTNDNDTASGETSSTVIENEAYTATFTSNSFVEIDSAELLEKGDMIYFVKELESGDVITYTISYQQDKPLSYNSTRYLTYGNFAKIVDIKAEEINDEYVAEKLDEIVDASANTDYYIAKSFQFDGYIVISQTYKGLDDEKHPNYENVKSLTLSQMVSDLADQGFVIREGKAEDYIIVDNRTPLEEYEGYVPPAIDTDKDYYADIVVKGRGTITVKLAPKDAPMTAANFVDLANRGFYDGLTFHRIIDGFMVQGGDPLGNGTGGPDHTIFGEFEDNGFKNGLKHTRGVISMARSGDPNSAGSQFFIMHEDAPHLDGSYAAFGTVESGIEIVDALCEAAEPTDGNGTIAPADQPVIESITIRNS